MRDRLVHDYFGVDYEIVWDVIRNRLPQVGEKLKQLLASTDKRKSG